jgi:hypothetical protein
MSIPSLANRLDEAMDCLNNPRTIAELAKAADIKLKDLIALLMLIYPDVEEIPEITLLPFAKVFASIGALAERKRLLQ